MLDVGIEKELHKDDASLVMHIYEATGVLKGRGVPARVRSPVALEKFLASGAMLKLSGRRGYNPQTSTSTHGAIR